MPENPEYVEPEIAADIEKREAESIARSLRVAAARLVEMSERLERLAGMTEAVRTTTFRSNVYVPYGDIGSQALHTVTWGIANLHLDRLPQDTSQADRFRVQRLLGSQ